MTVHVMHEDIFNSMHQNLRTGGGNAMLNTNDIMETITMIQDDHLDIRTITMGISLLDCCDTDIDKSCEKVYEKIMQYGQEIWSRPAKKSKRNTAFLSSTSGSPLHPSPC